MYLSYSGFKKYRSECPRAYWHSYVAKTKPAIPDNGVNSLYGTVVGSLFEDFYEKRLWKNPDVSSQLASLIPRKLDYAISGCSRQGRVIHWKSSGDVCDPKAMYDCRSDLEKDVLDTIPRGIGAIKYHRLLGLYARAEVKLGRDVQGHTVDGRADFIIERVAPHSDTVILDGKGSKHRDKYLDPKQLLWYGMLYSMKEGRVPDRLGFLYWKFEGERAVDWISFSQNDLADTLDEAVGVARDITQKTPLGQRGFPPKPSEDACRFCSYNNIVTCPQGVR